MNNQYQLLFNDIINGYSPVIHSSFGEIFIKHFSYIEFSKLDGRYISFLNEAKKLNIQTYKEREEYIIQEKLWSQSDEVDLVFNEKYIQDLKTNLSVEYLFSNRKKFRKEINEGQKKLEFLRIKKSHFIGETAEQFANKKILGYRINNSYYLDENLNKKLNNEDISDNDYNELIELYYQYQSKFNNTDMKKVSMSSFFTSIFYLCENNIYSFFGKPILQLTNHQVDLFSFGRYFKSVLEQYSQNIPKDIMSDPDQLIEYVEIQNNAKDAGVLNFGEDDGSKGTASIVGAQLEDYKMLGIEKAETIDLSKQVKKAGGTLNMDALMKIHGI